MANRTEIQNIELHILIMVAKFCEENGLRYFLAGGTLLGAVRHQGFIPWDDDVDIAMPREDYVRFIQQFNCEPNHLRVIDIDSSRYYPCPFAKVVDTRTAFEEDGEYVNCPDMGVYIDIFPIDGLPDKGNATQKRVRRTGFYAHRMAVAIPPRKTCPPFRKVQRWALWLLFVLLGRKRRYNRLGKHLGENSFDTSPYVVSSYGVRLEKEIIEHEAFADYIMMPFEEYAFRCPVGYDRYLKQMYGDYMQLPPVEEQVAAHGYRAYWRPGQEKQGVIV